MDLRCPNGTKFAVLDGYIEVKCRNPKCGVAPGVVVLHRFDPITGELVETLRFRDPAPAGNGNEGRSSADGARHNRSAVRSA